MKAFKYLLTLISVPLLTVSCYDLDIMPKNIVTQDVLLSSDDGIQKYFAITYHDLPIDDFGYFVNGFSSGNSGYMVFGNTNWEGSKNSATGVSGEASNRVQEYSGFNYWTMRSSQGHGPYNRIREINNFIRDIGNFWEGEQLDRYLAEARFLRAYYYMVLVRTHGGVVLMSEPIDPLADPLETNLPRSTEYDCWKFIYEDLKFAMENGTETKTRGRFNRYAAAALMSRAMLYAGTIAKYNQYTGVTGPATSAGFMGMPPTAAKEFFGYVLEAKAAVDKGGYSLHNGSGRAGKEAAFVEQFQVPTDDEDIFIKQYGTSQMGVTGNHYLYHMWDLAVLPRVAGLAGDLGMTIDPAYNLLALFEMPAIVDAQGRPVRFNDRKELWDNDEIEPRAKATYFFSGMVEAASGVEFDFQGGVYKDFPGTAADATGDYGNSSENAYTGRENQGRRITSLNINTTVNADNAKDYGNLPVGTRITGPHGTQRTGDEGPSGTGFAIRKYVSNTTDRGWNRCWQPFKALRYGEVLMNAAEAAYELGLENNSPDLKRQAFTYIDLIRERAGAKPYVMKESPREIGMLSKEQGGKGYPAISVDENLQFIRDERARELAFENHRIYDLIRWRVAEYEFLNGMPIKSLMPYWVQDEGKWIFLAENDSQGRRVRFNRQRYYRDIPGSVMERNSQITIKNDGY